jgi:hypothetical protein
MKRTAIPPALRALSAPQARMLRELDRYAKAGERPSIPYRRGAAQTAKSLGERGHLVLWRGPNNGLCGAITPEGAAALAAYEAALAARGRK